MNAYSKDKKNKTKKKYTKYKTKTTIINSFDTFVFSATTSSSITLSLTGIGLIAIPKSTATTYGLSIGKTVIYDVIINKYKKYKNQYEKDQQTTKSFDKLYRKSLQNKVIDKSDSESLCNNFTKYLEETKNESFFINMNIKIKFNFFSHNKIKNST